MCGFRYEATLSSCPTDGATLDRAREGADRLGPYRLIERMAVGGMGAVYRALNERVGRTVALKLLHQSLRGEPTSVSRFFHEARAVNIIRHPNVVEVYDLSGEDEDLYMVLEFLRGKDLRALLREQPQGRLPPARVIHILGQVCGALHATHTRKIVHRDLKPENIFLMERAGQLDFVKLLDFGVAKLERKEGKLTQEGIALGTPHYMAPEQARGQEVDARTDIYALGCIMFEMLTGRTVYDSDSPGEVMIKQVREPAPTPRMLNPQISEPLAKLVLRCLAKKPDERPQSALELARELTTAVQAPEINEDAILSGAAWDEPSVTSLELMSTMRQPAAAVRGGWFQSLITDKVWRLAIPAALVVVIAGLGLVLMRGRSSPPPAVGATEVQPRANMPAASNVEVQLESEPTGAEITDENGTVIGRTPQAISLPSGSTQIVRLSHPGHATVEQTLHGDGHDRTVTVTLEAQRRPAARRNKSSRSGKSDSQRARTARSRTLDPFNE